jgi:hypothetical protein
VPASRAQRAPGPGRRARLAGLLSWRTISGKLILGLVVLFGLAGAAVSVVTANSLSSSLMSSLNQQLQSATQSWFSCVESQSGNRADAYQANPAGYAACSGQGQAPGTFEVLLTGNLAEYKKTVKEACPLSATDTAALAALQVATNQNPPRFSGAPVPP